MLFPKKKQYLKWSVPSKWSYISGVLAVLGTLLTLYFGCWNKGGKELNYTDVEKLAEVIISRVLEGSPLCCDIKTGEVNIILPEEREILIDAESLIGYIPDSIDHNSLSFSYSTDIGDSIMLFNCKMVGRKDINVYFFLNNKLICSKTAIFELLDPVDFCSVKVKQKGKVKK